MSDGSPTCQASRGVSEMRLPQRARAACTPSVSSGSSAARCTFPNLTGRMRGWV